MVINTNVSAQSSARLLMESSSKLSKSLTRLSSGSKLTLPEDDAGGMAVTMRFDAQLNRLEAVKNKVGNAISLSPTQDAFLQKVGKALDRMSELATLSQDVTKTNSDLSLYQQEFSTLQAYITDIGGKNFNGVSLFTASALTVTTDSDPTNANGYTMSGINLAGTTYTTATSTTTATASTR